MSFGMAITAAAGPLSNLVLAVLATLALGGVVWYLPAGAAQPALLGLLQIMIGLNVNLALFNLIPVPPLDGSRILDHFVPTRLRPAWERVTLLAPFLLFGVVIFGGRIISGPSGFVVGLLTQLLVVLRPA